MGGSKEKETREIIVKDTEEEERAEIHKWRKQNRGEEGN